MFNRRKKQELDFEYGISKPKGRFFTFEGKTIWDVFQLLIIPLVIALIAILFNQAESRRSESVEEQRIIEQRSVEATRIAEQQSIEVDRARQNTLDNYFEDLTDLLLTKKLRESTENSEVRSVARALTLSALRTLDGARK